MLFPFLIFSIISISFFIWIYIAYWVYKDAQKRGEDNATIWLLIVLVAGIVGLIVWLMIRPPIGGRKKEESDRRCPNCGRIIPFDSVVCPYCSKKFDSFL